MKLQSLLYQSALFLHLYFFAIGVLAEQPSSSQPGCTSLSEPSRSTLYPELFCDYCIVPQWDRGYLLHLEIDKDSAVVTLYDRDGKKLLEARPGPSNAAKITMLTAGATHAGGILAAGGGILADGSIQRFIAKTDATRRPVQSVDTGRFVAHQVCEASDSTVWALGRDLGFHHSPEADPNVLRHYSFEKGLLGTFISLDSIAGFPDSIMQIVSSRRSYLRCGKEKVFVYLIPAAQYVEVHPSSGKLTRWNVDQSSLVGSKSLGFDVTDEGKIFAAFSGAGPGGTRRHGLYQLNPIVGSPIASLTPVDGTFTVFDPDEGVPDGTLETLWGADGNALVITRAGDRWGLSWASVLASTTAP